MKTMMMLVLAGALWLAGYYCGQRPGSPDLFAWAPQGAEQPEAKQPATVVADVMRAGHREIAALLGSAVQDNYKPKDTAAQAAQAPAQTPAAPPADKPVRLPIPECY